MNALHQLIDRYDGSPAPVRVHLAKEVANHIPAAEKEMIAIEERLCAKRDWLDANRTHPKHDQRREAFFAGIVREHAEIGVLINRALAIITTNPVAA